MQSRDAKIFALREELFDRGLNFATFSRRHGFKLPTVNRVVHLYWGTDRLPRGILGRRILRELNRLLTESPPSNGHTTASAQQAR
jgi:hypothetical protein